MPAILFLLGGALFGAGLVRRFFCVHARLSHAEQVLWGLVTGWIVSTLLAYLVARAAGHLSFAQLIAQIVLLWAAAALLWLPTIRNLRRRRFDARSLWRGEYAGLLLVLALFAPVFACLYSSRMLPADADGTLYSGGSTWYDLGWHLAVAASFRHGQNFPPAYTPFPPEPLLYPFLPDFQLALVSTLGLDLRASLLVTALPLALALAGLCYWFALRVTSALLARGRRRAAALAAVMFLLNGGLGFLYFLEDWRVSKRGLSEFWSSFETNYANMGERQIYWTNFIVDTMLPQRPSLFGAAAALMVFTAFAGVWREWSEQKEASGAWEGWRALAPVGVLTGLLPLFHTHSYLAVGLVSGFLFLLKPRRAWLAFWAPAVVLALPHVLSLIGHVGGGGFMRVQFNWRGYAETSWPLFWLRNVGVPLLLVGPAWLAAPRAWKKFYLAFAALMLVSLCVVFSPNDYDNIKVMYYWYAATCAFVAAWLVRLAIEQRQPFLASLLALASVATGLLALRSEERSYKPFLMREEVEAAAFARERTPARATFLTAPTHHQPILSLAGRPVLRGSPAWLSTHGYEFRRREADVRRMYEGGPEAHALLRYYRIAYVYVGPEERRTQNANAQFYEANFPAAHRSAQIVIYDTRSAWGGGGGDDESASMSLPPPVGAEPGEFAARLDWDASQALYDFARNGYAAYRYRKLAAGRAPRFGEFMADMKILGRGVDASIEGWRQKLEGNKIALSESLTNAPEFRAARAEGAHAAYADALYANAGVRPEVRERDALVRALAAGAENRASALRRVAENGEFFRRDYDAAYVLLHFFGYLRRNPDDAPDHNLDGYNFWLGALARTGDYSNLGMGFLLSGEYESIVNRAAGGNLAGAP